jgi:hypothetical protein
MLRTPSLRNRSRSRTEPPGPAFLENVSADENSTKRRDTASQPEKAREQLASWRPAHEIGLFIGSAEHQAGHVSEEREEGQLIRFLFAFENVDDFVAARARDFNRVPQGIVPSCERFNINQLRSTKFHRFQQGVESGSGPGSFLFFTGLAGKLGPF